MSYSLSDSPMPARTDTPGSSAVVGELMCSPSPTRIGSATMLATEILARGGTEQDCADILEGSVRVWFERHYAKWLQARQQRITKPFEAVYPGAYWYTTKSRL
jgi:hypothetical protein